LIRSGIPAQLPQISAFQHLDSTILSAMLSVARTLTLKAGEVLLYQGDYIHSFYILQSGGMRLLQYTEDGQCVALKVYGVGDVFGLLAISGSYPHPTQIEAIQESTLIGIDGQDARALMLDYPELALTIIDLLTAHVHEGHDRVRHMATKRVDRRLALTLLKMCDKFGKPLDGNILIDVPMTQRDLAEFSGTTVETINRTLTQWEKQGWLICSHKRLEICDLAALQVVAELS
jgi:CRP/FNR family transcriptional regulator